jgi:hypothetical protein
MRNDQFGLSIVTHGRELPIIEHGGKLYVAAPWSENYQLRIRVPSYGRYLGVLSVDGLDVMTGRTASVDADGYVFRGPVCSPANDIPGFRLNDRQVAAFRFGDRRDSYAAYLDKPTNVGVIAAVFYEERPVPIPLQVHVRRGDGGGAVTKGRGHDMGTAFGHRMDHHVSTTEFIRGREVARIVIEYASKESLQKAGIPVEAPLGQVEPFPADRSYGCVPPRNWRG